MADTTTRPQLERCLAMAQRCTVCSHPDAVLINEALVVERTPNRRVAAQYGVSEQAIRRHREHIPQMLVRASRAEEIAAADSILDRLEALHSRAEHLLDRAEASDDLNANARAIEVCRKNLEVLGEITKELDRSPTLNLTLSPQWLEIRTAIVLALEAYPSARRAVADAMLELESGDESAA